MAEMLTEFLARPVPKTPYYIGRGVLPVGGKMVIGGEPKANKSYIVLNMMLGLAAGTPIFDARYASGKPVLPVLRPASCLYIEQEMGPEGLQERFIGKEGAPGLLTDLKLPEGFPIWIKSRDTELRIDTDEGLAHIRAEIASVKPDIVILDPLAKFHLADENSAQQMGGILRACDHWIEDYGITLIYIHHTGKQNQEHPRRGGDRLRGSSAMFADVDTFMEVQRRSSEHHKEPTLELNFELRRGEPMESIYVTRLRSGKCIYRGEDFTWGAPPAPGRTALRDAPYKPNL